MSNYETSIKNYFNTNITNTNYFCTADVVISYCKKFFDCFKDYVVVIDNYDINNTSIGVNIGYRIESNENSRLNAFRMLGVITVQKKNDNSINCMYSINSFLLKKYTEDFKSDYVNKRIATLAKKFGFTYEYSLMFICSDNFNDKIIGNIQKYFRKNIETIIKENSLNYKNYKLACEKANLYREQVDYVVDCLNKTFNKYNCYFSCHNNTDYFNDKHLIFDIECANSFNEFGVVKNSTEKDSCLIASDYLCVDSSKQYSYFRNYNFKIIISEDTNEWKILSFYCNRILYKLLKIDDKYIDEIEKQLYTDIDDIFNVIQNFIEKDHKLYEKLINIELD